MFIQMQLLSVIVNSTVLPVPLMYRPLHQMEVWHWHGLMM